MDTLTCTTGVTRFLQIPPPSAQDLEANNGHDSIMWIYDKSEDATSLLHPGFWDQFDYALSERVETVIGKWEVAAVVHGFAGVKIVKPGEVVEWSSANEEKKFEEKGLWWLTRISLGHLERWGRTFLTRGWWIGPRMEPRIRILKKQRERLGV